MTLFRACAGVLIVGLAACGSPKPKAPGEGEAAVSGGDAAAGENVLVASYNLGDVDFATVGTVALSPKSKSPTIQYEEKKLLRGHVAIANANVLPTYPANLWVVASLSSPAGYQATDTVLLRMSVMADTRSEPLVTKSVVCSGKSLTQHPEEVEIDLMPFLNPVPASVLLQSKIQIVWFPDTKPETVNPDTVDVSKGQSMEKLSNPLRINFK